MTPILNCRTCIGCRRQDGAADMVRLSVADGQVVVAGPTRSGRGASIHARPACLEAGLRTDALARAFKQRVMVRDVVELHQQITSASRK